MKSEDSSPTPNGKRYIVYKHTAPNGKVYIGVTSQEPNRRWRDGEGYRRHPHFWNAIQKYGWDSFQHEILIEDLTIDEAAAEEQRLIAEYKSNYPRYGYNMNSGGWIGRVENEEQIERIRKSNHDRWQGEENWNRMHESVMKSADKNRRPVICIETGEEFAGVCICAEHFNSNSGNLSKHLKGQRNCFMGLHFKWKDEGDKHGSF